MPALFWGVGGRAIFVNVVVRVISSFVCVYEIFCYFLNHHLHDLMRVGTHSVHEPLTSIQAAITRLHFRGMSWRAKSSLCRQPFSFLSCMRKIRHAIRKQLVRQICVSFAGIKLA